MSIYSELIRERCLANAGQRILAEKDPTEEEEERVIQNKSKIKKGPILQTSQ
jgi:hypothetical protein